MSELIVTFDEWHEVIDKWGVSSDHVYGIMSSWEVERNELRATIADIEKKEQRVRIVCERIVEQQKETIEAVLIEYEKMKRAEEGNFAVDSMESYAEFYEKAVVALGFSIESLPSSEMDDMMLERISELTMPEEVKQTLLDLLRKKPFTLYDMKDQRAFDWLNNL
jgi:hypothetical protein